MEKYTWALIFVFFLAACKDENEADPCAGGQLQAEMLVNVADNIIVPGYNDLNNKMTALQTSAQAYKDNLSQATWEDLTTKYLAANIAYQKVAQFEFGPAVVAALRPNVNNFPVDTVAVIAKVQSQDYDFSTEDTYDKGFPALDYLLFAAAKQANGTVDERTYILEVVNYMLFRTDATHRAWSTSERDIFVENTGNAAGSSLSLLVNGLNQHYEVIKNEKIGIPAGVLTLGFTNPDKVEAYYGKHSLELARVSLSSAQNLYLGTANGIDGTGFDDLLQALDGDRDGQTLNTNIKAQFESTLTALNTIDGPLSTAVDASKEEVQATYVKLTENVVYLKTDLPSVLCVSITYVDNPSDSD